MKWVYDDGGRARAGFKGSNDDCVARAIAIATIMPYEIIMNMIDIAVLEERPSDVTKRSSSQTGVLTTTGNKLLASLGWEWVSKQKGKKKTYMKAESLPGGTIIVALKGHLVAVVDGVVHDAFDPSRGGAEVVLGYYQKRSEVGLCRGCGQSFKGARGLSIHQHKKFQTLACKPRSA